jgi:hypothetical protein
MVAVTISSVIDAPVEKVWARIRDFNGLPGWHPRMVESHIEDGKDAVGREPFPALHILPYCPTALFP